MTDPQDPQNPYLNREIDSTAGYLPGDSRLEYVRPQSIATGGIISSQPFNLTVTTEQALAKAREVIRTAPRNPTYSIEELSLDSTEQMGTVQDRPTILAMTKPK